MELNVLFRYDAQKYMHANFDKIFPNIQNINSDSYNATHKINASKNSINQFKIVNMVEQKPLMTEIINHVDRNENIKQIVETCLPHVLVNGKSIDIDRCVIVDLLHSAVQSFPSIHTDIEWGVFNKSDGFQIWYLYENDDNVGNMFLYEKSDVLPSTRLLYEDGLISTINQCGDEIIDVNTVESNIDPKVYYLDMTGGECLIFGKNLYHSSDHRKSKYRYSINCRVVLKDADGGIPINENEQCPYNKNFMYKLQRKNIPIKNGKIYCGMFDLMDLF